MLFGDDGAVAKAIPAGALLAVMSSIPVETAQAHAQKAKEYGFKYLDAPVSGGEKGAIEANLSIMVGGEPDVFEEAVPLFKAMGSPLHIGPSGTGQLTKLVNQLTVASTIVAVAEALLLAERGGADIAKVRQALLGGFAQSTILNQHGQRMIERNFKPGGPAIYQVKDTETAKAYAAEIGLDLPVLNIVNDLFKSMCDSGDGELDHSAVFRELCRHNKLAHHLISFPRSGGRLCGHFVSAWWPDFKHLHREEVMRFSNYHQHHPPVFSGRPLLRPAAWPWHRSARLMLKPILRLAIPDPIGSSVGTAATKFADYVKEETNGEVQFTIFSDGVLFGKDQNAAVNQLGLGALDGLILAASVYASFEPRMNAMGLPFLFQDYDQFQAYLHGEMGDTLLKSLEKMDIVGLDMFLRTFRDVTTRETPITKLEDFKGLKLRTPQQSDVCAGSSSNWAPTRPRWRFLKSTAPFSSR